MKTLAHILTLIIACIPAFAQSGNHDSTTIHVAPAIYLHAGAGFGILGFAYDAGMFYQNYNTLAGIRFLRSQEIDLEFGLYGGYHRGGDRPLESVWEIDTYVGQKFLYRDFTLSILTGFSLLGGVQRGILIHAAGHDLATNQDYLYDEYQSLNKLVVGIPIETRLGYTPGKYFDFGISYFVNINSRKTFKGFLVSFRIRIPFISFAA